MIFDSKESLLHIDEGDLGQNFLKCEYFFSIQYFK